VVRLLTVGLTILASLLLNSATGQTPSTVGSWLGVLDWNCDARNAAGGTGVDFVRLRHGALIPHGPYRGCVLMWGEFSDQFPSDTNRTFLWMPSDPTRLFNIPSPASPFGRDVGGISMTWDDEGQLVVVGTAAGAGFGSEMWRFFPGGLTFPPIATLPTGACNLAQAQVGGSPWRNNSTTNMSVGRYQATLIALCKGPIFGAVASGSTFVLGGSTSSAIDDGLEFWQALSPRSTPGGSAWSQTFVSSFMTPPHAPPAPPLEVYDARGGLVGQPTLVQHKSTPAALQLASAGTIPNRFTKSVFVAHDTNVAYGTQVASDIPGRTWVVRPRYDASPPTWEIWDGPFNIADRNLGTEIPRHDLAGAGVSGKNRVIAVGGTTYAHPSGWRLNDTISEYTILLGGNPRDGGWQDKLIPAAAPVSIGRLNNSGVVLPTGDILVVGGGIFTGFTTGDPRPGAPVFIPQLVRPGLAGSSSANWSVANMATSPPRTSTTPPVPRLRGHAAVLLPDGKVLVAGGEQAGAVYAPDSFTGEVFSPPYLFQGFRPSIMNVSASDLGFDAGFTIDVGRGPAEVIDAVVLLRPASTVFAFDTSQRYIELNFTASPYSQSTGIQVLNVIAPADDLGPPGFYMLFVVSHLASAPTVRVPSEANFVRLKL